MELIHKNTLNGDMSVNVKAADLSRAHLGQLILVDVGEASITDTLSGVSHQADLVDDSTFMQEVPSYALGRIATVLTFATAGQVQVAGETPVHMLIRGPRG